ncbi:MAG: prepilin-type N-terminal cleavage/methylation domain-containing protein [Proteobacteria bacterium]|nr:prepilin-type N-terminal cleavage/methylation domain-containing protein [Pseudomonadota bacterium]
MITHRNKHGFSLLELIVIILLVGIVASLLTVVIGRKISSAPDVIITVEREANMERTMERIMSAYLAQINGAAPDNALSTIVSNESTYEDTDGDGIADVNVVFQYITFNGAGAEVASPGAAPGAPTSTLKVTVYADPAASGTQRHLTTLLTQERTTAGAEDVVNY